MLTVGTVIMQNLPWPSPGTDTIIGQSLIG